MQKVMPSRPLAAAAFFVVLAVLAGCGASGSSVAGAGNASTAATASAVASRSAVTPASPKPSAAASTSAEPSAAASTAQAPTRTQTPTAVASTPRSAQSASALLDSALSAMQAQQSVHVVCSTPDSQGVSVDSKDAGVASGRVATTEGDLSITTVLVDGIAYVNTNTAGVWVTEGIPQAEAGKLAPGEWVSFKPGQSYGSKYLSYANAIEGMTVADQAAYLQLTGSLTRTAATSAQGVSVYGVTGDAPPSSGTGATESVYIAAAGAPLPVRVTVHSSSGTTTCDYSGWDESLNLTAPTNVVPVTAIPS